MDLTKLVFKKEQLRLELVSITECLNDVYRCNYGCEGNCEGNCVEQCDGGAGY